MWRSPSRLSFCLAAALCSSAPAALAQADATPPTASLPNAPSAVQAAALPIVNGRPYRQPTAKQNLKAYGKELFGTRTLLFTVVRAGIEQARTVPTGWGQDGPGFVQRLGSSYGVSAINNTVRFGMAGLLREDVHYRICHHCDAKDKIENALLAEVSARHGADGHRRFSATPIVSGFAGPMISYSAWYPPGYGPDRAATSVSIGFLTRIGIDMAREFLLDRDTKEEKAAREAASAGLPPPSPAAMQPK